MFSHLTQFTLNALLTAAILFVHVAGAWGGIVLASGALSASGGASVSIRRKFSGKRLWGLAAAGILILDLPVAYLQLVYKSYHPLLADQILSLIWIPWGLVFLNASFLCAVSLVVVGYRLWVRPRQGRRKRTDAHKSPGEFCTGTERSLVVPENLIRIPDVELTAAMKKRTIDSVKSVKRADTMAPLANLPDETQQNELHESTEPNDGGSRLLHRRRFIQTSAFTLGGLLLNGSVLAAAAGSREGRVERVVVRIPNLPPQLKGTTIAMISDIHSSLFMSRDTMEQYARTLQSLKAELIVLPGDFVNSKTREVYPFAEAFSGLTAPLGVYGVTGNHDYYTREIDTVTKEVEQAGIRLLRNENLRIEKNGVGFRLLGIDDDAIYDVRQYLRDGKTEKGRIEHMLKGIQGGEPTVFLCHKPYPFEEYAQLGMDLMLSGHTHGGQIVLGKLDKLNVSVASLASTYIAGLYKARSNPEAQMYISRGIGTAGLPVRINCPPEVTHITLT